MYIKFSNIFYFIFLVLSIIVCYKYYKNNKTRINKKIEIVSNSIVGFIEKQYKLIFVFILILFLITRLLMLGNIPYGIHVDEASVGYNAFCIAKYGVDRYLNPYPIYFLNFGNGQSAMYTYLAAVLIKIFGYSLFILRIPSVIFGLITLIFGYLIGKELNNKLTGLLVALLITICPYFIMASRFALDCNLMLGVFSASIYILLKAIKTKKRIVYMISGLLFGLSLYTYALSYLIIPSCLFGILLYLIFLKQINIKQCLSFSIPIFILAIPLILSVLVQMKIMPEIVTNCFSILKMGNDRASEITLSIPNIIDNIKNVPYLLKNDSVFYNAVPKFGTLYLFSIPLFFLGVIVFIKESIKNLKKREFNTYMYLLILFFMNFTSMLFVKQGYFYINHLNSIYIFLVIFLTIGIKKCLNYLKAYRYIILIVYSLSFLYFLYFYFYDYSKWNNLPSFDGGYSIAINNANMSSKNVYAVKIPAGNLWTALSLRISPYEYNEYEDKMANISFNIPNEINENYSYVITSEQIDKFRNMNFKCLIVGKFYECYKE